MTRLFEATPQQLLNPYARAALVIGGVGLVGTLAACQGKGNVAPSTHTPAPSIAAPMRPSCQGVDVTRSGDTAHVSVRARDLMQPGIYDSTIDITFGDGTEQNGSALTADHTYHHSLRAHEYVVRASIELVLPTGSGIRGGEIPCQPASVTIP